MKTTLFRSATRGHANHGWLDARHTFSFANYYDPSRIHFGALRVLNDDIIAGGKGFGTHPHDNMEIITIPLYGELAHKDSMGHASIIKTNEVQVMSAGTGLEHSEFNASQDNSLNLFQIWIFPDKKDVEPRYDQREFDFWEQKNAFTEIVSPYPGNGGLWIHQDAWLNVGTFDKKFSIDYKLKKEGNGVFAMVIEGDFTISDQKLNKRDGLGISNTDSVTITAESENARLLLIEVPMVI